MQDYTTIVGIIDMLFGAGCNRQMVVSAGRQQCVIAAYRMAVNVNEKVSQALMNI